MRNIVSENAIPSLVKEQQSLSIESAKQLSITNNTNPQIPTLTPRWFLKMLPWVNVESGIYRVNRVKFLSTETKIPIPHDMLVTTQFLKQVSLFESFPEDVIKNICDKIQHKETSPGETVIEPGKRNKKLYIVLDGQFDVLLKGKHGKKLVVKSFIDGDYFCEIDDPKVGEKTALVSTTYGKLLHLDVDFLKKAVKDPELKKQVEMKLDEILKKIEQVSHYVATMPALVSNHFGETSLPRGYIEYSDKPLEIHLNIIQTVVGIHTRINELYNVPFNQLQEQLKIAIEHVREREEWEIINNKNYGLLNCVDPSMAINTRSGPPTPDDLDSLLSMVWKKPSFFLAHPKAIAAFMRECTYRGVPPVVVDLMGSKFVTWRGIPLIPSDKLAVRNEKGTYCSNILLMRAGESDQGVVGLHNESIGSHCIPSLSIQHMGINEQSISNYLVTKYSSAAVLVPDALAVLRCAEVGSYPHYD